MKIAFLVWNFPVLSEPFILNQITGLLDRGHEVDIYRCAIDSRVIPAEKVHPDVISYRLLARTYTAPKRPKNPLISFAKALGLLLAHFPKYPRKCWRLLSHLLVNQSRTKKAIYRAIPFLNRPEYDIIHCQFGTLETIGLELRSMEILSGKIITTFRGIDISRYIAEKGEDAYKVLFTQGNFFLANCEFFRQKAIAIGCPIERILVHGSGIDCQKFTFQPRSMPRDGKVCIATTGRLVEKKGIAYCIEAIARIIPIYPNFEYNIIGDGELRTQLEELISKLQLGNFVKILGWKNQREIIEILEKSHLFLAPSITAIDGNQDAPVNTLKEAMAMGLPVISTDHGGIPELVENGVSGFLVPERDSLAIADKLLYLITHSEQWEAMGKAGRAKVLEKYDKSTLNDELVQIYQSLVDSEVTQLHSPISYQTVQV
jgi:colanic acid/amylovoran biosynthesis glycosyltransferase